MTAFLMLNRAVYLVKPHLFAKVPKKVLKDLKNKGVAANPRYVVKTGGRRMGKDAIRQK